MKLGRYLSKYRKQNKIIVSGIPYVDYYPVILILMHFFFLNPSFSEWHHSSHNRSTVVLALIMDYITISLKQQMY